MALPAAVRLLKLLALAAAVVMTILSLIFPPNTAPPEPVPAPDDPVVWRDAMPDTYAATDALGRTLPGCGETGPPRAGRYVGLFYWTWHTAQARGVRTPVNVTRIVERYPEASHDLNFPLWGPLFSPHHWNEPLFGYYDTDDRWVLRRHAEMLANAGVDVIIFDNTNGTMTWKESYDVLFEVFAQARAQGVKTPKIAFLLPFSAGDNTNAQLRLLYGDIYSKNRYQNLWFYWKGKPLIMAHPDKLDVTDPVDRAILGFFTFRPGNPDYKAAGKKGEWGWLSVYPQVVYRNRDGSPEQTTVGVAQNYSAEAGLTAMNGENVFGRTYTSKGYDTRENAALLGANFAEQFEYALKVDPEFIFITGFNEWVAGRFDTWQGVTNAFPDEYNDVFSRDIEPSKGALSDCYYYQMASFIRRYKGARPPWTDNAARSIRVGSGFTDWAAVPHTYYAYPGNTFARDDTGYGGIRYTDDSGRNDIAAAKVASDAVNIYFMVECAGDISPRTDERWMRLLLDTRSGEGGFCGFDYIVNRVAPGASTAVLERSAGGWNWEPAAQVRYEVEGNRLQIAVPKAALGIGGGPFTLRFKWSDNTLAAGDAMDFYLRGDTAPLGRFTYVYVSTQ